MSDISSSVDYLQSEDLNSDSAISENGIKRIGASLNYLLDQKIVTQFFPSVSGTHTVSKSPAATLAFVTGNYLLSGQPAMGEPIMLKNGDSVVYEPQGTIFNLSMSGGVLTISSSGGDPLSVALF